jgi:hypothetical protein
MSLEQATYTSITDSLNAVYNSGATPDLNLFSDSEGKIPLIDENGNSINNKTVVTVNYTEPHNEADGTQVKNGYLSVIFSDGVTVTITDNVDTVYFNVISIPFKPRTF